MINRELVRTYSRKNSAVFHKTNEKWGGFSNMASNYPIVINGVTFKSSEALYQCCRFTDYPEIQSLIIEQPNALYAKRICIPHMDKTRKDWMAIRVIIMKWCVCLKLSQNFESFSKELIKSSGLDIVEYSEKDNFWGAMPTSKDTLQGGNVLGRILMELRRVLIEKGPNAFSTIPSPKVKDLKFLGLSIEGEKISKDDNQIKIDGF
ncbi:NADAR family protein [Pectobacterium parvum]|uniref:NADAR family protein n=1 Tax=Pectobacterium TaxID=122277 RepID=UPI002B24CD16|nr:NADAR family protein [Pectobacterium carotovorum]